MTEADAQLIIKEFSNLPSLDNFYFSIFSMTESRKYKVLGTDFSFKLVFYYDINESKYYYKLFLEDTHSRYVPIEDAFDLFPTDVKDWVIYNLDLFRKRK